MMRYLLVILLIIGICFSCAKQNLRNAKNSLEGTWNVVEVYTTINSVGQDDSRRETGNLGQFVFTKDRVDYNFLRRDFAYLNSTEWELTRTKENAGFTKVEVYTLTFDNYSFKCQFGDQTRDAERKATQISLVAENEDVYQTWIMQLEKE